MITDNKRISAENRRRIYRYILDTYDLQMMEDGTIRVHSKNECSIDLKNLIVAEANNLKLIEEYERRRNQRKG